MEIKPGSMGKPSPGYDVKVWHLWWHCHLSDRQLPSKRFKSFSVALCYAASFHREWITSTLLTQTQCESEQSHLLHQPQWDDIDDSPLLDGKAMMEVKLLSKRRGRTYFFGDNKADEVNSGNICNIVWDFYYLSKLFSSFFCFHVHYLTSLESY